MDHNAKMMTTLRGWTKLQRLVVVLASGEGTREEEVALGVARRRWKRLEPKLAAMPIVAARGYDQEGKFLGEWKAAEVDDGEDLDELAEAAAEGVAKLGGSPVIGELMSSVIGLVKWSIEEVRDLYRDQLGHSFQIIDVLTGILKGNIASAVAVSAAPRDQAAETMQMILQGAMHKAMGPSSPPAAAPAAAMEIP